MRLRNQSEAVERCRELADELGAALARLPEADRDREVVDAVWRGECLGALLWALRLAELPPYDEAFSSEALLGTDPDGGRLRSTEEVARARDTARLWHWRARTAALEEEGVEAPPPWESFQELVAATALHGCQEGLLPIPLAGDFPALGLTYGELTPGEQAELQSIAVERQQAFEWLLALGDWDDVPLDT